METSIKPTVWFFLLVLIVVTVGVPLLKFVFNKWNVPGLTDLVNAI